MTAEAAVVLPVLAIVALLMSWVVSIGLAQVRVVDAARETARAAARQESQGEALSLGRRVAPEGAQVTVRQDAEAVVARVVSDVRGPGGVFAFLGPVRVSAEAVAAPEPIS